MYCHFVNMRKNTCLWRFNKIMSSINNRTVNGLTHFQEDQVMMKYTVKII